MFKVTWKDGLIDAESLYKQNYSIEDLYSHLNKESALTSEDYRWSDYWNGFHDYIGYLNECKKKNIIID